MSENESASKSEFELMNEFVNTESKRLEKLPQQELLALCVAYLEFLAAVNMRIPKELSRIDTGVSICAARRYP